LPTACQGFGRLEGQATFAYVHITVIISFSEETKAADSSLAAFGELVGDIPYTARLAAGDVRRQILDEAENGYDLLIMGNPFRRGLEVYAIPAPPRRGIVLAPCCW